MRLFNCEITFLNGVMIIELFYVHCIVNVSENVLLYCSFVLDENLWFDETISRDIEKGGKVWGGRVSNKNEIKLKIRNPLAFFTSTQKMLEKHHIPSPPGFLTCARASMTISYLQKGC